MPSSRAKIALSNAQMILDSLTSIEHTAWWSCWVVRKREVKAPCSPALTLYLFIYFFCTHPLNMTGSLRSQFTDLKVFICCPVKDSQILTHPGNFCMCGFLDLVFLAPLVISPTGMPFHALFESHHIGNLADHPSSKGGIVCFSSEFLSHLSDTFLFGTIHGLSCFVGCLSSCMHFRNPSKDTLSYRSKRPYLILPGFHHCCLAIPLHHTKCPSF